MLSISILFNFTKNFNRILNLEDYSEYPFPEIRKIIYKSTTIQNMKFNSPISQEILKALCVGILQFIAK